MHLSLDSTISLILSNYYVCRYSISPRSVVGNDPSWLSLSNTIVEVIVSIFALRVFFIII